MRMVFPRARLVVSACLFVAWLGYLLFLVLQNQQMVVLSRPQLLTAPVCVVAEVRDKNGRPAAEVVVERVVWAEAGKKTPEKIEVQNLPALGEKEGYKGPGTYILPLAPLGDDYLLVPIPFPVSDVRIYSLTRETEWQLEEIKRLRGGRS